MTDVLIRPAHPFDAAFAVPLIQATIGRIGLALTGAAADVKAERALLGFYPLRGNRLSFEHQLIAQSPAGEPLGLILAYPGEHAEALDEPFRERLRALGLPGRVESEGTPGELYVDTLAVTEAARGRGTGGQLLDAAAERAAGLGLHRVGLLVEDGNPAARLYARQGFRPAGTRVLAGGTYTHLVRDLT
ncbi:GNAT family N-acetyltransferase [Deinococcus radiotolerans]|uniref:GNAT family N-acetyltransferase n=1 Tax=Deinococcus radiotolerans TaxID=1309407 RepID=A0ABQ2FFM9_9DEIO|nr:GNAT family N-acetyltransferase [Deinococcus radiotolerans]GGK93746.1 GNAT family N-acetyltransferase [Deinococcus radiotolerans]